jgi:hypothetical protein
MANQDANLFELWGRGIHVSYSTTSIGGIALFHYNAYGVEHSFKGADIRVDETELGRQVSVTLVNVPDLKTTTFTVVIPKINIGDDHARVRFHSVGVHADHFTSIGGPDLVTGALTHLDAHDLHGVAQAVSF